MNELDYKIAGDRGILIYFGGEIGPETFQRIRLFNENLLKSNFPGVKETFPGYRTLFISYEPSGTDYDTLVYQLKQLAQNPPSREYQKEEVCFEIPIVYDGPDLPMVAKLLNILAEEITQRHLGDKYLILLTGGAGGIAYFKFRDKLFDLPRKKTPAFIATDGAVGFAAGIGSAGSRQPQGMKGKTSGWWFIGRTPIRQWLPDRDPPVLIKAGDWIRYKRVDADDFDRIAQEVDRGTYELHVCKT
jgi:allophanate hydrolase subunit 1